MLYDKKFNIFHIKKPIGLLKQLKLLLFKKKNFILPITTIPIAIVKVVYDIL